jgi:RIO kinase 1
MENMDRDETSNNSDKWLRLQDTSLDKWRTRIKDADDKKAFENVFDNTTLKTLYRLADKGALAVLEGAIAIGKEANVFLGRRNNGAKSEYVAVKIYRTTTANFKKINLYIAGDPRFRSVEAGKQTIYLWAKKEFSNLTKLFDAGVSVPKPIDYMNNVLVMTFIGSARGIPAPELKRAPPQNPTQFAKKIIKEIRTMYRNAGLVHGDLSEYNILLLRQKPIIIDVGQAVVLEHPRAEEFFVRDLKNISRYLGSLGVTMSPEELIKKIKNDKKMTRDKVHSK